MKKIVIALVSACAAALPAARTLDVSAVDSRYLADADGRTFVPVGGNICFPRMYDAATPGALFADHLPLSDAPLLVCDRAAIGIHPPAPYVMGP